MKRKLVWRGAVAAVVLFAVLYGLVSYMIASGVTKADREPQEDHPSVYGLSFEDVEFASRGGDVRLEGWYIHGDAKRPTLIFVHGMGSNRSGDNAVRLAARLAELGYDILLFDLRGHGTSDGEQVSGGYRERWDLLGAVDFVVMREVPVEEIGILGFSMGAGTAILALAEERGIRALVADSPYARATERIAQEAARKSPFPEWIMPVFIPTAVLMADVLYNIDIGALVPEEAVARLPYPILVIHGLEDTRIPPDRGERVHSAAFPGSDLWLVPGVDHVDAFPTYPEEYVKRVTGYFDDRLERR